MTTENTQRVESVQAIINRVAGRYTTDQMARPVIAQAVDALKARDAQIADNLRLLGTQLGADREDVEQALVDAGLIEAAAPTDTTSAVNEAVAKIQKAAEDAITSLRQAMGGS
jgi:hypothetical protein